MSGGWGERGESTVGAHGRVASTVWWRRWQAGLCVTCRSDQTDDTTAHCSLSDLQNKILKYFKVLL